MFFRIRKSGKSALDFQEGKIWGTRITLEMINRLQLKTKDQVLKFLDEHEKLVTSITSNHFDVGIGQGIRKLRKDLNKMKIDCTETMLMLKQAEANMKKAVEINYNREFTQCLAF